MEQLLAILKNIRPDVDFENEKALIEDGILDSFDVVSIISELDDEFGPNWIPRILIQPSLSGRWFKNCRVSRNDKSHGFDREENPVYRRFFQSG